MDFYTSANSDSKLSQPVTCQMNMKIVSCSQPKGPNYSNMGVVYFCFWWPGVAVMHFVRSSKLLYAGLG